MKKIINQCDGCRRGLPLEDGIHIGEGYDMMGCTKHVYEDEDNLVYRLRKRAEIRRQIPTRKSVQEGQPDRLADLLEEAADEIVVLEMALEEMRGWLFLKKASKDG
jgi:hypothetical protein